MKSMSLRRGRLRWAVTAAALASLGISIAIAEDVVVNRPSLKILAGKGSAYGEVTEAKKGDRLEVLAKEGNWTKVRLADKEGWVTQSALAAGSGGSGLGNVLAGGAGGSEMSTGAAGKGMTAEDWAKGTGKSPAGLQRMEAMRQRVTPEQWQQFMKDGNVGPEGQ